MNELYLTGILAIDDCRMMERSLTGDSNWRKLGP